MNAVELHRIDPTQNMRRFYRLDMQPDLFGGVLLDFCVVRMPRFSLKFGAFSQTALPRIEQS